MQILFFAVRRLTYLFALSLSTSLAAESLAKSNGPAELPPAGFTGSQFVDSKGCVYIRTGGYGAVKWFPRVTQKRQLVCGFEPSFKQSATAPKNSNLRSVQPPVGEEKPVLSAVDTAPKPKAMINKSQTSLRSIFGALIGEEGKQRGKKVEQTQFPLAVQTVRGNIGPTRVPEGYRSAWEDDRLNPSSGLQTVAGLRASDQIWSRKAPREMAVQEGKTDMGTVDRQLVYPFTDIKQQRTFLDAKGNYVLEPRDGGSIALVPREKNATNDSVAAAGSTVGNGGKLVQVATFGVSANAARTKVRLAAMGLPVQARGITRSGKTYQVILIGPFADADQVNSALATARNAGFRDAFVLRR